MIEVLNGHELMQNSKLPWSKWSVKNNRRVDEMQVGVSSNLLAIKNPLKNDLISNKITIFKEIAKIWKKWKDLGDFERTQ